MGKKNSNLFSVLLIVFAFCIASLSITDSRGIFEPQHDNLGLKNPIPIYLPDNFHVWDNHLYFHMYDSLYQYDISTKPNITRKNHLDINPTMYKIAYFEDTVYIFHILPASTPDDYILFLEQYTLDSSLGFINRMTLQTETSDSYVFVANMLSKTVAIINDDLVLATNSSGGTLEGILEDINEDISEGEFSYLQNLQKTIFEDSFGYLLAKNDTSTSSFGVFDFTNYTHPTKLGDCSVNCSSYFVTGLTKVDNTVYIETDHSRAFAVNVTDKSNPEILTTFSVPQSNAKIKIHNQFAFVVTDWSKLTIYNITQITSPIYFDTIISESYIDHVTVFDELLIVTESMTAKFYDWLNPSGMVELNIILPTTSSFDFKAYLIVGIVCFAFITIRRLFLRKRRK